jgi:hypothetical protein
MTTIEERIAEFLTDDDPRLGWLRDGVREHRFLPLYLGWLATLGIRPDGSMVSWEQEEEGQPLTPLTDPYYVRMALFQGSLKYPELAARVPARPREAVDCAPCRGTGRLDPRPDVICSCGGLGWTIPGEERDISIG